MTQYEVETFQPPYMSMIRPSYAGTPQNIDYGQIFTVTVSNPGNATAITGNLQIITSWKRAYVYFDT
jgi:hypothetical protein